MKAINTYWIGPSNVRGSRIKATDGKNSITLHWDDALDVSGNHKKAAEALVLKMKWTGRWISGGIYNKGEFWVIDSEYSPSFEVRETI